jgi:fructose-1,6-bisphosphatase/sedoheptulose 1,7-bisphosphatase-like protein
MLKNNQVRMTIDIDKAQHKTLKHIAVNKGKSLRDIVLDAIDKMYIEDNGHKVNTEDMAQ